MGPSFNLIRPQLYNELGDNQRRMSESEGPVAFKSGRMSPGKVCLIGSGKDIAIAALGQTKLNIQMEPFRQTQEYLFTRQKLAEKVTPEERKR